MKSFRPILKLHYTFTVFVLGTFKNLVHSEIIRDVIHSQQRVIQSVEPVSPDILSPVLEDVNFRLICAEKRNGAVFNTCLFIMKISP